MGAPFVSGLVKLAEEQQEVSNHPVTRATLGLCCEWGLGTKVDPVMAAEWTTDVIGRGSTL